MPRSDRELVRDLLGGDPLLTTAEVAALFRVDSGTVNRWAVDGKLTGIKTLGGGEWRFRESVVRASLEGGGPDVGQGQ